MRKLFAVLMVLCCVLRCQASNEIQAAGSLNKTCYAIVISASGASPGQYYNANTPGFEAINTANWTSTKYCIAMTESGGANTTGFYMGTMPSVVAGRYSILVYQEAVAGTVSLVSDTRIAAGTLDFTGTKVASLAVRTGTDGKDLLSSDAQTGVTIPTVSTVTNNVGVSSIAIGTTAPSNFLSPSDVWGVSDTTLNTFNGFTAAAHILAAGAYKDPWSYITSSETGSGTFGLAFKTFLNALVGGTQVVVGDYGTGKDPATLLFGSTLLSTKTDWATGSYGYLAERAFGNDIGNYSRVPTTGVITLTMPNGLSYLMTLSVNGFGQIIGRVVNP